MNDHKVSKAELLERVKHNRAHHRQQFEEAQSAFRQRVIEELDRRLKVAQEGGRIDLRFSMPEPQLFLGEYDAAIEALEWEIDDEIIIDHDSFRQLVLNQWHWAPQWAASTQVYLAE